MSHHDFVLVGGGLQNALIALGLAHFQPHCRIAIVERGATLGGNHTWSFHRSDVPAAFWPALEPLISAQWHHLEVRFPSHQRRIASGYASIASEQMHSVLSRQWANTHRTIVTQANVVAVDTHEVRLADGRTLTGDWVVASRGPGQPPRGCGFQKFVGWEVELEQPCGLAGPVLMDATVTQEDGYRFVYVLPFEPRRILIEDTYYSDTAHLDGDRLRQRIRAYADSQGWTIKRLIREEEGALPIPWSAHPIPRSTSPLVGGFAGGWFHPTTGYSLPIACRVALLLATTPTDQIPSAWDQLARQHARASRWYRWLNWAFFRAAWPDQRYKVLERFYRLPQDSIERFYSLQMTATDWARLLFGQPPKGLSLGALLVGGRSRHVVRV